MLESSGPSEGVGSRMALKDEIFTALSREPLSIAELCQRFGVTRNAIVVQINQLTSAGLVEASDVPREGKVGKPAARYRALPGNEDRSSGAYRHLSLMLVKAIQRSMSEKEREEFYRAMGRAEAKAADSMAGLSERARVERVCAFVNQLGAAAEIEVREKSYVLKSFTCPIGSVVRIDDCGCLMMASLFEALSGLPTEVRCKRQERLVCQFKMKRKDRKAA